MMKTYDAFNKAEDLMNHYRPAMVMVSCEVLPDGEKNATVRFDVGKGIQEFSDEAAFEQWWKQHPPGEFLDPSMRRSVAGAR